MIPFSTMVLDKDGEEDTPEVLLVAEALLVAIPEG
jgi:hypothetical protein